MFPLELGSLLATPSDWECLRSNTGKGKPRGVVRSVKALCSVLCLPRLPSSGVTDVFLFSYPFSSLDDSELERRWEGVTREDEMVNFVPPGPRIRGFIVLTLSPKRMLAKLYLFHLVFNNYLYSSAFPSS